MFTGIVTELGKVVGLEQHDDDARITVHAPTIAAEAALGDSVAVSGVCLTVTSLDGDGFAADVMPETMRCSTLGSLAVGAVVNLEPALTPMSRLGGHIVQGHVDGVGTVVERDPGPRWDTIRIALPRDLAGYVVAKGSIAVDGVSLTVVEVGDDFFTVGLIPTTLAATTMGLRGLGDQVNLEVDVLAKHVARLLEFRGSVS
jgi:riboflavin synthase